MLLAESTILFAIWGDTRTEYLQPGVKGVILLGLHNKVSHKASEYLWNCRNKLGLLIHSILHLYLIT